MNIDIRNLSKNYDCKSVIHDMNLHLEDCHSLAIIGPSGGGKTTLLRILAGLERISGGTASVNGFPLSSNRKKIHEYRKTVGVVFQALNLFPHLTALENIVLPLVHVHEYTPAEASAKANDLLFRFQLEQHTNKKPHQLSGGQKQRVAIARALAIDSRFLVLDEPTSALDPELTGEVLDMIHQLREQNKDIILATHEMGFARLSCDYVVFMSGGRVLEEGPSKAIFGQPRTRELKAFLNRILEWREEGIR